LPLKGALQRASLGVAFSLRLPSLGPDLPPAYSTLSLRYTYTLRNLSKLPKCIYLSTIDNHCQLQSPPDIPGALASATEGVEVVEAQLAAGASDHALQEMVDFSPPINYSK